MGYKTKLPVTAEQVVPSQLELTVTGIEPVQTPAGKFNCYKISFAAIGETFWIGAEASRPLVKFQSGNVEAELVKVWGQEDATGSAMAFLPAAGWYVNMGPGPGPMRTGSFGPPEMGGYGNVWMRKIYTPSAEIAASLRQALDDYIKHIDAAPIYKFSVNVKVRPGSLQQRLIGGKQALSCILDFMELDGVKPTDETRYLVWIRTESTFAEFEVQTHLSGVGVVRWQVDPVVATAKIP